MIRASCLCGDVRFEISGALSGGSHCHCSMCRKAHGAAFGSFLHSDAGGFRWTAGQEQVENYPSSPGNVRAFCKVCGSNLPVLEDEGTHVIIPAGSLDDDPRVRPVVHIHVASKAPWYEIGDGLPRFAEFPPDAFWTEFESGPEPSTGESS